MLSSTFSSNIGNSRAGAQHAALYRLGVLQGLLATMTSGLRAFSFAVSTKLSGRSVARKNETRQGSDKSPLAGQQDNQYGYDFIFC